VNEETQALFLNALPLLGVAALYLVASAAIVPGVWRERGRLRDPEVSLALVFPVLGIGAALVGSVILVERQPLGNVWIGLAAIILGALPATAYLLNWGQRTQVLTASSRVREAAEQASAHQRQRDLVNAYTGALSRVSGIEAIARRLTESVASLLDVEFAALVLHDRNETYGVRAQLDGEDLPWWRELRLDLREPSAIASATFEAAPFAVYDVQSTPSVNQAVAEQVGAKSGVWVPLICGARVIGVLAVATTHELRSFTPAEVGLLQELASETALAIAGTRSGQALERALERERLVARISQKFRSELDLAALLDVAVRETAAALGVARCFVRMGEPGEPMPMAIEWTSPGLEPVGDLAPRLPVSNLAARERRTIAVADVAADPRLDDASLGGRETLLELGSAAVVATPIVVFESLIGVVALHRLEPGPWADDDVALIEAVAHELGLAVHTARLLEENARRLRQQASLLEASQAVTAELQLETVLKRLVDEVAELLGGDAADCYLIDERKGVLRCAAVKGLPEELVGFEFDLGAGLSGEAIGRRRAVIAPRYRTAHEPVPHDAYQGFESAIVAPISAGEDVLGVLGVGSRLPDQFDGADAEVIGAFAGLAALALRNAQAFEERSRQARIQRGFYRIASVLGQPLALTGTLDAVAQAAADALGGSFAAVLMPRGSSLELVGSQGLPSPLADALSEGSTPLDDALAAAAADGRLVSSPDVAADDRFSREWRELATVAGYSGLLAVPVVTGREDADTGLVLVGFAEQRRLDDDDLELARHLAGAARGALERSALYEEERAARSLAQQLARTGSLLATELDPAAVLDEVVRQAPRLVGVEACAIRVVEDDELVVTAVESDGDHTALVGSRSPATVRLSGDVVQSRSPVAIEDASADDRLAEADPLLRLGYVGFLGVPLIAAEGAAHGVLSVYSRRPRTWRNEEIEALLALAANASAALSNAELYQRVAVEKERSYAILANIADGIVAVDRDGTVVLWNRAAEQITGVPAHEAVGRRPSEVLGRSLESEGDVPPGDRLVPILRGGEDVWLSLTEAVMRDPAGVVAGRIFAFRDISSEHLVEQMKSDFVSTVSQELRRPLTSIYGFAETLLRQDVLFGEEERRTFLGYIASESERLTSIVDALLSVARLDSGDLQLNVGPTDVRAVVSEVVDTLRRSDSVENSHRFVVDLPGEKTTAEADPERLRQVLQNLIDNAVKFSPGGGTVTVTARRRAGTVDVSVIDEGIGIPSAEQARIFRKFYRADSSAAREAPGGTGLGLFIARGLVAAMGGRMWVTSKEGEGSRFTFELPAAKAAAPVSGPPPERVEIQPTPERL
jgi:PAS domain S-box-containing protein